MKKVAKKGWCITAAVMAVSVIVCIFCFVRWERKSSDLSPRAGAAGSARPLSRAAEPLHRRRRQHAGVRAHGGDRDVQCLPGRAARGALVLIL